MESNLIDNNNNKNNNNSNNNNNNHKQPPDAPTLDERNAKEVDGDDVINFLDRLGRYQKWQMFLIFMISTSICFPILNGLFVGKYVDFQCTNDEVTTALILRNASIVMSTCSGQVVDDNSTRVLSDIACTDFYFKGNDTHLSYLAEWKLVCDDEALGNLPQTFTMVGMAIGASTLPHIGDRYGRKTLMVWSLVCVSAVNLGMAFVKQIELFMVLKFLCGALNQGFMVPVNVLVVELLPTDMRAVAGLYSGSFWVVSCVINGVIGYMMRDVDWRTLQIVYGAVTASVIILTCFLDESLRWLLGNGKVARAEAVMKRACRMNNKDYGELMAVALRPSTEHPLGEPGTHHKLLSPVEASQTPPIDHDSKSSSQLLNLMRNANMRKVTAIMCYTWMICALTYYGLMLLSTSLAGNPYVNYFIQSIVEWPACAMMVYCFQKFGRKPSILTYQTISGISLVISVLIANFAPENDTVFSALQTSFVIIGKFFISASFNGIWTYTPEIYPTNLRNIGIGMASASARIGATFSPFFTMLARKALWAPGALFATGCFLNVFLLTMVPETRGRELPKDITDIDQWIQDDKNKKKQNGTSLPMKDRL